MTSQSTPPMHFAAQCTSDGGFVIVLDGELGVDPDSRIKHPFQNVPGTAIAETN